ncbi:MAG: glycoside hydrolase family 57 protein [Mariprofundales bacterium]|nr:glycoside hydrolase family 57 protein [Mariprofundales bacterium]
MSSNPLSIIFCWHMHQPFYRMADDGRYHLPWVYLHAMKEYTDMAEVLAANPAAKAVVNFVPSLSAQIKDYAEHLHLWQHEKHTLPDPLLDLLARDDGRFSIEERNYLLEACFRLQHERNLYRYSGFAKLKALSDFAIAEQDVSYLADGFFTDLVTWYHLGWLAETVRDSHPVAKALFAKGGGFVWEDRRQLIGLIAELLAEVSGRYAKLAATGQIELSTTPYAHPIMPLMLDFHTARETVPDAMIPPQPYPGGRARAVDHIQRAQAAHQAEFGRAAYGCWPAEGAVSTDSLALLGEAGMHWCATGEAVLHHSLGVNVRERQPDALYHPWQVGSGKQAITCFFRDDQLSDRIGFEYSKWGTGDAVANFIHELTQIRHRAQGVNAPVVVVAMDGENAWEHYDHNGIPFLTQLYQAVVDEPGVELTTFEAYTKANPKSPQLEHLVSGSWVYGNLSTWIGDPAKTRGWELIIAAKKAVDVAWQGLTSDQQQQVSEQLSICEGSDWCWWFGDYNPSDAVRDFDHLYRSHLAKLYAMIGQEAPESLGLSLANGSGGAAEGGGTMRRGGA